MNFSKARARPREIGACIGRIGDRSARALIWSNSGTVVLSRNRSPRIARPQEVD